MPPDSITKDDAGKAACGHPQRPRCVLLVDDSPEDRGLITELINRACESVTVESAETGQSAMRALAIQQVDCVILDYRLETEDGLDVMARIKDNYPFCPVIILIGQGDDAIAATSIKSGAFDCLVKSDICAMRLSRTVDNAMSHAMMKRKVADQEQDRKLFLQTLVHDLRAPLRLISQLGELALEEADSGNLDDAKELIVMQNTNARRASALINSLEAYALLDKDVEFTTVSFTDIALQAHDNLRFEIADRNAEVSVLELSNIAGDKARLIQLFQNLIQNGLKYNESDKPTVCVRMQESGANSIELVVEDNGIGIEPHARETIFKPLQRMHSAEKYEGTGLGLAICKKIVLRHNGEIWCESTPGKGTAFHMKFPKAPVQ